jgi:hypothetical protein
MMGVMPKEVKKHTKRSLLIFLAILFSFILPLALLITGIFIFRKTNLVIKRIPEEQIEREEGLTPSQILANKSKYSQQKIAIRGRVVPEPVVCERKECPLDDSCCGCPSERNLAVNNPGQVLSSQEGSLRLVEAQTGKAFCTRQAKSCDYLCGDWVKGAVYDVNGEFFAESPPPGWKLSLNYYFQVESKELVKRVGLGESFGNFVNEIKEKFKSFKTSGYYVLP